ncbi:MAG: 2Fe-2S iron-sulfur cluster binding domain-containing protein, partial [Nitrospinaceae bacterium]|nr:2Fe-2S iron-sulfur cluster binding domain-containing protein [Nitrospinaceae bacterium]NIR55114.1 2Fe-2S iron-sulfur cluster binding domain-containing protein [Nitrospinaceae bacterium]NIS85535.1 2Fe-2S iron-sulfur cluster binding domain-containing protein [Nitrospinaceae bacterium]NIT82369.1 2Fe-2S iron-sulfur cluster binding domain-containing protein [Nitrospinaceae bacterium]NIU44582.1 2Fe-2S iron-sulfur cluster binding domain-containing protein [Nitrospinaceae bacterium]
MLEIYFENKKRKIKVQEGENLREAAIRHKLSIYPHIFKILNCRGRGLCTSCAVEIVSGDIAPRNEIEQEKLKKKKPNIR